MAALTPIVSDSAAPIELTIRGAQKRLASRQPLFGESIDTAQMHCYGSFSGLAFTFKTPTLK